MEEFDYWRLCDDLSISQAACLVIGVDPSENYHVENWNVEKRPRGYEAAKTAIVNGIRREDIYGTIVFENEYDMNGNICGKTDCVDLRESIVSVISLKNFLRDRGITSGFFFPSY